MTHRSPAPTSVVIVAYRRPRSLARMLMALLGGGYDVVVVNVGGDPEVDAAARAAIVPARVITVDNRGYASAVNAGAVAARGDVIVFTNDDVHLAVDVVDQLADAVRTRAADVALPRLVGRDGHEAGTPLALPTPDRLLLEWALLPDQPVPVLRRRLAVEKWRRPATTERVAAGTAAVVAVRTDLLRDAPLPEAYFMYWEEVEWFWRLQELGAHVVIVPATTVVHDGGRHDVRPEKSRLLARNAVRCVRRTQGVRAALLAYAVVVVWNARLLLGDVVRAKPRRRLEARLAGLQAALGSWIEVA
ncbi:MAG TPA: glycosyltransferase [Acidimicrobiia bacterium]|jgi:GT2 family glycosyltransferase